MQEYGYGRSYFIHIKAQDANGNPIEFDEVVNYPDRYRGPGGQVSERERESDGIAQVKKRMPHLINVRANGSVHT